MNVWLVNAFDFLPAESNRSGRYGFIADLLVEKGHSVTWWTSNFFHWSKQYRSEGYGLQRVNDNFEIRLLPTPAYKNNISLRRIYNHRVYCREFLKHAREQKAAPDVIVASLPPIGAAHAAIRVAEHFQAKVVIDIIDIWPEVFLFLVPQRMRKIGKILLAPLFRKVDSIYRDADAIIAVSQIYRERGNSACAFPKPGMALYLGMDLRHFHDAASRAKTRYEKKDGEIWISYVGTLGKTYDLDTILASAKGFTDDSRIKFMIAGGGPEYDRLLRRAGREGIDNVIFAGILEFGEMARLLKASDIGLNAYAPGAPQSVPNKIFDYFAAGLPVVNSLTGELRRLIEEEKVGEFYEAGNPASLTRAIHTLLDNAKGRREMGARAYALAAGRFDRRKEYSRVVTLLSDLSAGRVSLPPECRT